MTTLHGEDRSASASWFRFSEWLVKRLPRELITDTFQVTLAATMISVGVVTVIGLLIPSASSLVDRSLGFDILRGLWSASFIGGGLAQLFALRQPHRSLERLGMGLSSLACTIYAIVLFARLSPASIWLGLLFFGIAFAYVVRLIVGSVARRRRSES